MKNFKRVIGFLLVAVMLLSSFTVGTFAAETKNLLILGDSIAYGLGVRNSSEACYGKILADTCGFGYENLAISGTTTDFWIGNLKNESVIKSVENADIISMSIGGNDFLMDNLVQLIFDAMVKEDYTRYEKIALQNYENLNSILSTLKQINPDADIFLQTLYNPQYGNLREPYQVAADKINENIYRCSENFEGITVVDVATALGDDRENFAGDAVHPSAKGNELIASEILKAFNEKGLTDKTELVITHKGEDRNLAFYGKIYEFIGNFFALLAKIF